MIYIRLVSLFLGLSIVLSNFAYAATTGDDADSLLAEPTYASWVFSGVVTNESGENYGYFFQMQRHNEKFHAIAAPFDGQNKSVILLEDNEVTIPHPTPYDWQVGRAFMRFNPINNSWIFGLKTQDKKGFNFKVDMLKQTGNTSMVQDLRPGVELLVNQTNHLNGHVQAGDESKEQFVTAKNAWFRQIWMTSPQQQNHPFTGVLCRFHNGSGFYSVNLVSPDALRGAVAGWSDEQGISAGISQFVNVKQDEKGPWHIRVTSPNLHLVLTDFIKQDSVVAGFVEDGKNTGFCMLSNDKIGELAKAAG